MPSRSVSHLEQFVTMYLGAAWLSRFMPENLGARLQAGEDPEALAAEWIGHVMLGVADDLHEAQREREMQEGLAGVLRAARGK